MLHPCKNCTKGDYKKLERRTQQYRDSPEKEPNKTIQAKTAELKKLLSFP